MFNLIGSNKSNGITQMHSDPFKHECVERIMFWVAKDYKGNPKMHAEIELINGKTKAEHRIDENDFPLLVQKVKEFIDSLPK